MRTHLYPPREDDHKYGYRKPNPRSKKAQDTMYTATGAMIDDTGRYRYRLWRTWDAEKPRVLWVMLNPSTADGRQDDPTIRRCVGFARTWGYGGIDVVNLYALRATYPSDLRGIASARIDVVGPDNDSFIRLAAEEAEEVVCGWGAHPIADARARLVCAILDDAWRIPQCLGVTKEGYPKHPLYVPASTALEPYKVPYTRKEA